MSRAELDLADWRRQVAELYAAVRHADDPRAAHATWRAARDRLFRTHSQSPLADDDPLRRDGLAYWPYDPDLRFECPLIETPDQDERVVATDGGHETTLRLVGRISLPVSGSTVDVWWLDQYAGGLFVPLRDGSAGTTSYGGGRYLLDTAKGADLGGDASALVIDLNFLYHPSCRYDPRWQCPLAPPGNTIEATIEAGERL